MNCPHCNALNDPNHQYCIACGQDLHATTTYFAGGAQAKGMIGIFTLRTILALFGLMILNTILTNLDFIKEFDIPDFNVSTPMIFTLVIYIIAVIILVNFALTLRGLWPSEYPRFAQAVHIFTTIIYLIVLSMAYRMLKPLVLAFTNDYTPLMLVQLAFILVTIVLVGRVSVFVYQNLPLWLSNIKESLVAPLVPPAKPDDNDG